MNLKILTSLDNSIKRNNKKHEEVKNQHIYEEKSFDRNRFYIFSHLVNSNTTSLGLQDNKTKKLGPLTDELLKSDRSLVRLRFIIIDRKTKLIYFDGNRGDVLNIICTLFDLEKNNIHNIVDPTELERLTKIKFVSRPIGQMTFNDVDDDFELIPKFEDMFDKTSVEKAIYEIQFKKKGTYFPGNKLNKFIDDNKSDMNQFTAEGYDSKGHYVKISSVITKEISILPNKSSWADKIELELIDILNALKKELDHEII